MASKKVEDIHMSMLNKLLSESGLECVRSPSVSEETSSFSGEEEQIGPEEEETPPLEQVPEEEEEKPPPEEEAPKDLPYLFPTPSLRKVLPDRIRKLQELNRIHVLPEEFKTDIDPTLIPKIVITTQQKYIDTLAELVGCTKYQSSLAEFWFLDTLANLLRRAQDDNMNRTTQAILIKWFCEWMKEIQHFDAANRERMLRRFKDNMLAAAKFVAVQEHLPTPKDAEVYYKAMESPTLADTPPTTSHSNNPNEHTTVTFEGAKYECSLVDLCKIIHYIYDLFSTDYQFDLVRSIFTFTPEYSLIDAPYQLQNPKRLFVPMKVKPAKKEKSPKKESEKDKAKSKVKHIITEEYLALMALKARDEREQEERQEREREEWYRRCHILPLNFATDDALFDKYWPPPPPEPVPEPKVEEKAKPKGKGKK